jgi:hypothetical protein
MRIKELNQIEFSSVLFDTLFGLVLFFSLDSFLEIKNPVHFILYLFSAVIVIHWWLIFKSADDAFESEVTDSIVDTVFGIVYIIFIEFIVLHAREFDFRGVLVWTILLLFIDLVWTCIWKYVGEWKTTNKTKIKIMERELSNNLKIDIIVLPLLLLLLVFPPILSTTAFITLYMVIYMLYIWLSLRFDIIDIRIF